MAIHEMDEPMPKFHLTSVVFHKADGRMSSVTRVAANCEIVKRYRICRFKRIFYTEPDSVCRYIWRGSGSTLQRTAADRLPYRGTRGWEKGGNRQKLDVRCSEWWSRNRYLKRGTVENGDGITPLGNGETRLRTPAGTDSEFVLQTFDVGRMEIRCGIHSADISYS